MEMWKSEPKKLDMDNWWDLIMKKSASECFVLQTASVRGICMF